MVTSISLVIAKARAQIEGFKSRPDLAKAARNSVEQVTALLDKLTALEAAQETLKKGLLAATDAVQQSAVDLHGALLVNIAQARTTHGPFAPELALLGGKPRKRGRRAATPPTDATGSHS